MGFFNRRAHNGPAATNNGTTHHRRERHVAEPYTMATRPTFGQWLKATWLDIVTMVIMGALGLGIYMAHPAPTRSFAVTFTSDDEVVYPEFAYPMRKEIIPIWLAAFLASVVPIFIFLCMQIRVRSFWDVNNATIGLLYSLITAAVFQVFLKWLIGGLRPHFLAVCKPDVSLASAGNVAQDGYNAAGFKQIYYTDEICTGDRNEIDDSLESFPSGHTTAAFAGFVFLYLYLNAKLKVFSNYHPAMWKLVAIYAPILGATLIGGALTIDEFHNWYDIVAGAIIGTVFAFSAYRMTYAAVWDWRYNHIPLHRGAPFGSSAELSAAVFTRRAGWGSADAMSHLGGEKHHGHGHGGHSFLGGGGTGVGTNGAGATATRKPVGGGVPPARGPEHMV